MWWIFVAVVGAWTTLLGHELSHAVCVWLAPGARLTRFRVWPEKRGDRWFFGSISHEGTVGAGMHWAPLVKASTLLAVWSVLVGVAWWQLWPLIAWEVLDVVWWFRGWFQWETEPGRDGARARASQA